jgi:uncharacterized protein (DUF4415 family)
MTKKDDDRASRPDHENPEWTRDEIHDARPALEVFEDLFGPDAAETVRRGRGRPAKADKKVNQTLRLDVDVLAAYRQNGPGWQVLMNQVLREHMPVLPGKALN